MEDHSVIDPTYVEDFLLTFVVFFNKSHDIASKLLKWFERPQLKDKVLFLFISSSIHQLITKYQFQIFIFCIQR